LQELAKFHRNHLKLPIVALTGSNGKTTTKELINAVLSKKYITKATVGNLNNHIGVPLTLLSFTPQTEIGIVEMGANHQKEIEFLCEIAQPDYGYITNFGKAHLEGFGGVEGVIKGKSEMYTYLSRNQ
jgi:UDP-N-acetylmuramoyl-tripeptide--D-alanyl-D-alanine ligase